MKTAVCCGETAAIMRGKESLKETERERERSDCARRVLGGAEVIFEGKKECEKCGEGER